MALLFSSRLRRWLILAVAVPLASLLLARIADRIGERSGESTMTRAMRAPQNWRQRRTAKAA